MAERGGALAKIVLYNSKRALNRYILSTFSSIVHCEGSVVLISKTDVSTAPLFNIVKPFCGSGFEDRRLDGPATILYCEGTLR